MRIKFHSLKFRWGTPLWIRSRWSRLTSLYPPGHLLVNTRIWASTRTWTSLCLNKSWTRQGLDRLLRSRSTLQGPRLWKLPRLNQRSNLSSRLDSSLGLLHLCSWQKVRLLRTNLRRTSKQRTATRCLSMNTMNTMMRMITKRMESDRISRRPYRPL